MEFEEGCGALNLVIVTEPLKVARLMLGVDPTARDEVRIMPRLPQCVTRIEAKNWPLLTPAGIVKADLQVERTPAGLAFTCAVKGPAPIPQLALSRRVGETTRTEHYRDVRTLSVLLAG